MSRLRQVGLALMTDALMRAAPLRRQIAVWRQALTQDRQRPRPPRRTAIELSFLPSVLEIVDTPASPAGRGTMVAILALFAAATLWACLGKLDIHATAVGRIIPQGKTKAVTSIELANVAKIHVHDGDHVQEGQALVDLDPSEPAAEVLRLRREQQEQMVTAARLRALLANSVYLILPEGSEAPTDLLSLHRQQLQQKLADHRAVLQGMEEEKRQRQAERMGNLADIRRFEETLPLLAEQADVKRELAEQGWQSRTEYLRVEQERIDRQQALASARHKLDETEAAIAVINERLRQSEAQFRGEALLQLAEAEQKQASLTQELAKAQDRRGLYELVAPVAGVVQQLSVHARGAVVGPSQPILMIVPEGEGLAIEASLSNRDAGFVHAGQPVEIKVDALPYTRFGSIPGEVLVVSGDAVQEPGQRPGGESGHNRGGNGDETDFSGPSYSVRIKLLQDHIRAEQQDVALTPGMAVIAEIKTGKRRLIEYLLDPVLRFRTESLHER